MLSRRGSGVSHLFFVDDLVVFCRANENGMGCLKHVLDQICPFFGHKVNRQKTQLFFFHNVSKEIATIIYGKLHFSRVNDLEKYLDVPFFHNSFGTNTFKFILDKIQNRPNRWDASKLSLVSRLTLVKLVLLMIPNYFIATARIPIMIYKEIEKLACCFLWGT